MAGRATWILMATFWYLMPSSATAIPPFMREFQAVYAENSPEEVAEKLVQAKCTICHIDGPKKTRTLYGSALEVLLDKKRDAKAVGRIRAAFQTVEAIKLKRNGETFGQMIRAGKLEELMKPPKLR